MSATRVGGDQSRPDSELRITVARTAHEAEAIRGWFERIAPQNLDSELDFFLTVTRASSLAWRPHVVLFERPDRSPLLAVARVEQRPRRFFVRGTRVMRLAFGGVVGAETPEEHRLIVDGLGRALAEREADVIVFSQLDVDGPLYDAVRSAAPWWRTDHVPRRDIHRRGDVPASLDEFLAGRSSSTRYHVRRYTKRLARDYGENLSFREFREPADLGRLHADLESVAARTYQRGLGVGYVGDQFQRAVMEFTASRGWLRAWVLYISETPVAFWFGYCYQGTFYLVATGFDPAHGESRVGQYLQMKMMGSLCRDPEVHSFDYGLGEAEYKRRFGDHATTEAEIRLYAPGMRAAALNAGRTVRVAVGTRVRGWIARSGLGTRARKARRRQAQDRVV
jgi:Acetyltransferase (GNAT) domain